MQEQTPKNHTTEGHNRYMKIAFTLVAVVLVMVALTCLALKLLFGVRFDWGHSKMQANFSIKNTQQQAPLGIVRVIAPASSIEMATDSVGIRAYNEIYAAVGVGQKEFAQWESKHGMDSYGVDEEGRTLAPSYPVLSKVAWMYIDPVMLTPAETSALIHECERAMLGTESKSAKDELAGIRALAEVAVSRSSVIEFGHP
jgi:hypothetical protein